MTMTLAEARTKVRQHLDDADSVRWSDAQVDAALESQLDACTDDYISAGGDRLAEEISASTTANSNAVDLSSYDPRRITGVTLLVGSNYYPLRRVVSRERSFDDNVARSLRITVVRTLPFPTTTTHPLIGNGATAAQAFRAMEEWVVMRAAQELSIKDGDVSSALLDQELRIRENVLGRLPTTTSREFPRRNRSWSRYLRWYYEPSTQTVNICRVQRVVRL